MNQQKESAEPKPDAKTNSEVSMATNPEKVKEKLSENKPRPTPWTYRTATRDGKHVPPLMEIIDRGGVYVLSVLDESNADLIVKAVNEHDSNQAKIDKLTHALKTTQEILETVLTNWVNPALADAKGE